MQTVNQTGSKRETLNLYLEQFRMENEEVGRDERSPAHHPYIDEHRRAEMPADDIAIIGMAGRFPDSPDLECFWENLKAGQNLIHEIPPDRWDWRTSYGDPEAGENKTRVKHIGAVADVFGFDISLFGISPREAEAMDPHQRVLLEVVWATLEQAGYTPAQLSGTQTGVFVAMYNTDFLECSRAVRWDRQSQVYLPTGANQALASNRISYLFNWRGPSEVISTACSSALVALHKAAQAIRAGDCQMALVGGVSLLLSPARIIGLNRLGILSPDGYCAPFDKDSPGEVLGEGAGAVLLKPLSQARRDGDTIYAILKATGTNHHGNSSGSLTMPSVGAQTDLIVDTYRRAGIDPSTIGFIEAHGSGNTGGDVVEVMAFKEAFASLAQANQTGLDRQFCGIGSGKGNTGFLEAAGGMAQLIKMILSLQHKTRPATINFKAVDESLNIQDSPFYIVDKTIPWEALTDENGRVLPRRGALNAYGLGGTNAHIVIEEAPIRAKGGRPVPGEAKGLRDEALSLGPQPCLVVLSARNEERLREMAKNLHQYLTGRSHFAPAHLQSMAYTLQVGRQAMESRVAFVVKDEEKLCEKLAAFMAGQAKIKKCYRGQVKPGTVMLRADKGGPDKINTWLVERKLEKLARQWVKGVDIDWGSMYGDKKPDRINLPAYPFARKRYWLPNNGQLTINNVQLSIDLLHPLIHRNISTFTEQRYSSVFSGAEFFLTDHRVWGEKVLPAVAYLEMARAAVELAGQQPVGQLKDIVWTQPLKVTGPSQAVIISLYPAGHVSSNEAIGPGEVRFEISTPSDLEAGARNVHSYGRVVIGSGAEFDSPARLNIADIRSRCSAAMQGADCYRRFQEQGVDYGLGFQGLEELRYNTTEVLARLRLPDRIGGQGEGMGLHPSLMDAALQATIGLSLNRLNRADSGPYLPFAVQQVSIYGPLPERAYAYVRYSPGAEFEELSRQTGLVKYDVAIADEQGQISVSFVEFTVRALADPQIRVGDTAHGQNGAGSPTAEAQASPVANYYDAYGAEITLAETEELYLNYLPFPEILPGFSWVKLLSNRYNNPRLIQLVRDKHRELRNVLFRIVDFSEVKRALDIGCGYGSDLIRLAKAHDHLQLDGYTISSRQVDICSRKIALAALQDRIQIYHRDSTRDSFPGRYDLIYGIEVMVHIKDKKSLFVNIERHLNNDGYLVVADFTSNIRTEIDLDDIGTYTITGEQWLELFTDHQFELYDCVDVSQEMSNSLYDPGFHQNQNADEAIYETQVVKQYHEMDNNLHLSLKKGLVSYVLMVLRKNEAMPKERLSNENRPKLGAPIPYHQIIDRHPELSLDSQGYFSKREPALLDLEAEAERLELDLIEVVKREVKEILKYDDEDIDAEMTFESLGVKSLNAVEIIGALNTKLDLYLKTTLLFSYPTIAALAHYILAEYGEALTKKRRLRPRPARDHIDPAVDPPGDEPPEDLAAILAAIDTLSPDEIEALNVTLEGINHA